ncbi:5-methyltetrahydropteroyltriglutamate--homocysteine S-methyltransferase [Fictibacillus fluitans]
MSIKSSNLGYPRIGENREWKKVMEKYWAGGMEEDEFQEKMKEIRLQHLRKQQDLGIDMIPVGDFSFYDHVLDTAVMFGLVPKRFNEYGGKASIKTYYDIARGTKEAVASEMTKWFNTNYHYIVPELDETKPSLIENRPLQLYQEAKRELNIEGKPVILGPVTFVKLSKGYKKDLFRTVVDQYVPLYAQLLRELEAEGVTWVQIDEPVLATSLSREEVDYFQEIYKILTESAHGIRVILQTYYESVDDYQDIVSLPVHGIGLDFVQDDGENLNSLIKYGFPEDKVLAAGIINGRNIWRANLEETFSLVHNIQQHVADDRLIIQPSSSLLHVPVTKKNEKKLEDNIKNALSFADEKLHEISIIKKGLDKGITEIQNQISDSKRAIEALRALQSTTDAKSKEAELSMERKEPFRVRRQLQQSFFQLPLLPTTTIGSFPQTPEVKKQRSLWRKGQIDQMQYEKFIKEETERWIKIQEKLGLDVFVHGEFERTDMVEYFGEKLEGFQITELGWVQSYGSRCVKPPIIYGDVSFRAPMTLKETLYAQSLTLKPVKGMLTGPITILNWSFARDDISKYEVANQIAFALREEVRILEENGIRMIQVDEPALREGVPLKEEKKEGYLHAAVNAFKLATASVENETQIHTHMCYSNFKEIMGAISEMDADVISIETSKSHGELIHALEESTYDKGIGLGVYDIHSPRIPLLNEIKENIERALNVLDVHQFWINPDCGLKTRGEDETISALQVMVEAAKQVREEVTLQKALRS